MTKYCKFASILSRNYKLEIQTSYLLKVLSDCTPVRFITGLVDLKGLAKISLLDGNPLKKIYIFQVFCCSSHEIVKQKYSFVLSKPMTYQCYTFFCLSVWGEVSEIC